MRYTDTFLKLKDQFKIYQLPGIIAMLLLAISLNTQAQECHCDDPNATIIGEPGVTTNLTTAIAQGLLAPMPNATTTPQQVCIRGTLNVNATYTFTSSQINMDADASIVVTGFLVTLKIHKNSIVYGCGEMWQSITASPVIHPPGLPAE
ncbi:MAG: hypothetical protein EPO28_07775 [Saprospiraceae bacterium]|nr:MAG: hypothetical protein EPO28_07775 [Saprospiraceae bacterium]